MSRHNTDIYFSIRNGVSRQVSREEWEREWLRWWRKISKREAANA